MSNKRPTPALVVHQDNIWGELDLKIAHGYISGTLDNFLGLIMAFIYAPLALEYSIPIFFTKNEEIDLGGSKILASHWDTKFLPIAIDVTLAKNCDCSLENFYGFSQPEIRLIRDSVENHEDFKCKTKKYSGNLGDCDDSWSFVDKKIKTFTFGIPVVGNFHTKSCKISIEKFLRCQKCLKWVLSALL